jgi:hypothetical protein
MKRSLLWKNSSLPLRPSVKIRSSAVDLPLVGEVHLRQVPLDRIYQTMFKPSNDRKAGSAVTRSAFSIMAWAPSSRSKGSLWGDGNSPARRNVRWSGKVRPIAPL